MEVCGSHTECIAKAGLRKTLDKNISLVSGPGCPVCVTDESYIHSAIQYATKGYTIASFFDLVKVKDQNGQSLYDLRALGYKVKTFVSPLEILNYKDEKIVLLAVGFETTAPVFGILMEQLVKKKIQNVKLLMGLKQTIPAIEYIIQNEKSIDGFIAPGHVSAIIGANGLKKLSSKYKKPMVIEGFDKIRLSKTIDELIGHIKNGEYSFSNNYDKVVSSNGNLKAKKILYKYFDDGDSDWRGIGTIKNSGYKLKPKFKEYGIKILKTKNTNTSKCRCEDIILGRIIPNQCPLFHKVCNAQNPKGPCMVSSEGACRIYLEHGDL